MRFYKSFLSVAMVLIFCGNTYAQVSAIGQWRDHLPYRQCIGVAEVENLIYCATPYSVFYYDKDDNNLMRLTKIEGLSDVGVSNIKYNKEYGVLVITYSNANIDLIKNKTIINISDIKRKPILGKKTINNIYFINSFAYLSCGFGIVVLDLIKEEIRDTYYIGPSGSHIDVLDLTSDATKFYAATENGIYTALINSPNLANYESWFKDTLIRHPNGKYNAIEFHQNKIFTNYSDAGFDSDTLFYFDGNRWIPFDSTTSSTKYSISSNYGYLLVSNDGHLDIYDAALDPADKVNIYYYPDVPYPRPLGAIMDKDDYVWIADKFAGLIRNHKTWLYEFFTPNGPYSANVYTMAIDKGDLWVASGGRDVSWGNQWNNEGVFSFVDQNWSYINHSNTQGMDTILDILSVAINPGNRNQVYAGSWGYGLIEINNGTVTNVYNQDNSTMHTPTASSFLGIAGLFFDEKNNLWITNSRVSHAISVKTNGGHWYSYNLSPEISENEVGSMIIDSYDQKWIILPRDNAIVVFTQNGTFANLNDDNKKRLKINEGNDLSTNSINCLAEDLDGEMWVGTDKGIKVYYSPEDVFNTNDFYAQTILVEQDGYVQHLFEFESVTAIAVDGSNRKWIGTEKAGVFLMSEDGTEDILHFTEDNSPLFSNVITSIVINHETGEVFFGTTRGIISYKGTATKGGDTYNNVYAYPNPVDAGYYGSIAIIGLVTNADVKITDISGNLIHRTVAEGGQAIWNGNNYSGERARSDVYLVFCSNNDGTETLVTKILFIN